MSNNRLDQYADERGHCLLQSVNTHLSHHLYRAYIAVPNKESIRVLCGRPTSEAPIVGRILNLMKGL